MLYSRYSILRMEGGSGTRTPLLLPREVERDEELRLDSFWLGQHLPMITDPHPTPNPSTSRQDSAGEGASGNQARKPAGQDSDSASIRTLHTHSLSPHPRQPHLQVAPPPLRLPMEGDRVAEEAARVPGLLHHQELSVQVESRGDAAASGHHQGERAKHPARDAGGAAQTRAHGCKRERTPGRERVKAWSCA